MRQEKRDRQRVDGRGWNRGIQEERKLEGGRRVQRGSKKRESKVVGKSRGEGGVSQACGRSEGEREQINEKEP